MQKAKGLEYELHGEGQPVLLIHGSHVADAFLPLAHETILKDRYQLIRYHRRGFAGSDPHTGPFSIEEQAQDALALLEALGVARAHVIGYSFGAVTALQLICAAPSVVHALVLLEPPKTTEGTGRSEVWEPLIAKYRAGDATGAVDASMTLVGGHDWRNEVQRTVPGGPEQAETDAATFFEVELPALGAWTFNADQACRLSQSVLYIVGSESGPHFDRAREAFQTTVTQTEAVVLLGLNHLLQMRNPHVVAAPIADFLARHPL